MSSVTFMLLGRLDLRMGVDLVMAISPPKTSLDVSNGEDASPDDDQPSHL